MSDPEDKGYKVEDRRYLHMSEAEKAKVREQETAAGPEVAAEPSREEAAAEAFQKAAAEAGPEEQDFTFPEITFASFIFSLSSSAFASLGAIPDPNTGKQEKNLPMAKQTIDLLGLLREKTRNNLTPEEEGLFDSMLHDLRMSYVKEVS